MFLRRIMQARFTLAEGGFAGTGKDSNVLNTLDIKGLRMSAKAENAGGSAMGKLSLTIYGMTASQQNTLSTLGMRIQQQSIKNSVTLLAGDTKTGLSIVFDGGIQSAYADPDAQPQACFRLLAFSGLPQAVTTIPATSYQGAANVATVLAAMAKQSKPPLTFENNGVNITIPNQYYSGDLRSQIKACCEAAGIGWTIDKGTLSIWPRNGSRTGGDTLISPKTSMIGYPSYTAMGIRVRSFFNPSLKFQGKIKIESDQDTGSGTWTIQKLEYDLDSEMPNGKWECAMECINPDAPTPVSR
jgi:hypothetical protein